MGDPVAAMVRRGTAAIATAFVPDAWWGWGTGIAGAYYGKKLADTYTPGLVDKIFSGTTPFFDPAVIVPLVHKKMVTLIMPVSASLAAFAGFYLAVVVSNLALRIFNNLFPEPPPKKTPTYDS